MTKDVSSIVSRSQQNYQNESRNAMGLSFVVLLIEGLTGVCVGTGVDDSYVWDVVGADAGIMLISYLAINSIFRNRANSNFKERIADLERAIRTELTDPSIDERSYAALRVKDHLNRLPPRLKKILFDHYVSRFIRSTVGGDDAPPALLSGEFEKVAKALDGGKGGPFLAKARECITRYKA